MIAVKDIAYVRYQAPDLDAMESFLVDFGLHRTERRPDALYMRTAGPAFFAHVTELGEHPRTLGFGLEAQSGRDLDLLAGELGVDVEESAEPGGGLRVRLVDPDGFQVDIVHGRAEHPPLPRRDPVPMNPAVSRKRFGQVVRLRPGPSTVMRLGHLALLVSDFRRSFDFYSKLLGLRASDTYYTQAQENTIAAFMHCGLGDKYTDHHTLALISAGEGAARFDHSAFEVLDLDDLMLGGEHLQSRQRLRSWGVGRHVQGSQLFDYWRDPFGNKIEHWTDGDLVNDSTPVGHSAIGNDELSQWAPPLAPEFFN